MQFKNMLLVLFAMIVLSSAAVVTTPQVISSQYPTIPAPAPAPAPTKVTTPPVSNVGGYSYMTSAAFKADPNRATILSAASKYLAQYVKVSALQAVFTQTVSGMNYSLLYLTEIGLCKMTIYYVPWTGSISLSNWSVVDSSMTITTLTAPSAALY